MFIDSQETCDLRDTLMEKAVDAIRELRMPKVEGRKKLEILAGAARTKVHRDNDEILEIHQRKCFVFVSFVCFVFKKSKPFCARFK